MLARLQKSMKEKDQGFTLIELLVVIVIIGILAAIAIPLFLGQRQKGVDAGIKSDLKNAATQIESYSVDSTWSAAASAEVGTVISPFTPTSNNGVVNTIIFANTATNSSGGYCLEGSGDGMSDKGPFWYDSTAGGLVTTDCTITP